MPAAADSSADLAVERRCAACGYDLRGLIEPRCPECGTIFDPKQQPLLHIPWLHRQTLGFSRAYWLTVWMYLIQPRQWAQEVKRKNYRIDANGDSFRWTTVLVASLSAAMTTGVVAISSGSFVNALVVTIFGLLPAAVLFATITVPASLASPDLSSFEEALQFKEMHKLCCAPFALVFMLPLACLCQGIFGLPGLASKGGTAAAIGLQVIAILWATLHIRFMAYVGGFRVSAYFSFISFAVLFWLIAYMLATVSAAISVGLLRGIFH